MPTCSLTKSMKRACASAAKAEAGAACASMRGAALLSQALGGMSHPQPPTRAKAGSATASGILGGTMRPKYLKGAGMRANWMKDRIEQGQLGACWEEAATSKGGLRAKRHPPSHFWHMRPTCLRAKGKSPSAAQGCASIMKEGKAKKARRKGSPKPAEPQPGARRTAKLLPALKCSAYETILLK